MVECMIAYHMPTPDDLACHLGVTPHVLTHPEEGGLHLVAVQDIQQRTRYLGLRTIVKGQIDALMRRIATPYNTPIEALYERGKLI